MQHVDTGVSPFFTVSEAAAYARCSTRTIRRWMEKRALARYGGGRRLLVLRVELEALLASPQGPGQPA